MDDGSEQRQQQQRLWQKKIHIHLAEKYPQMLQRGYLSPSRGSVMKRTARAANGNKRLGATTKHDSGIMFSQGF